MAGINKRVTPHTLRHSFATHLLEEALHGGPSVADYEVMAKTHRSSRKLGLKMKLPTDLDGTAIDPSLTTYAVELKTKILLTSGGASYFDQARAVRE